MSEQQNQIAPVEIISAGLLNSGGDLALRFKDAQPFPLLVLDDFLHTDFAWELYREFPSVDAMPKSRDYMFGNKHELSSVEANGPASALFYEQIMSDAFRTFLSEVAGTDLFVDADFFGGGFHQGADGSFLDMHVDFNVHPLHEDWLRTINFLLYLNPDWKPEYGGELLIRSRPDEEPVAIAPSFNRAIVMLTDQHTFHGYKKMSLPPGVTRKSIATYAYQRMAAENKIESRTTGWVPDEAGLGKRVIARHYNTLVKTKNRYFGSRTARNR